MVARAPDEYEQLLALLRACKRTGVLVLVGPRASKQQAAQGETKRRAHPGNETYELA